MRLFLQQKPMAGEAPKYVQLVLQQDLLGGWTLLRESGQLGGKSALKRANCGSRQKGVAPKARPTCQSTCSTDASTWARVRRTINSTSASGCWSIHAAHWRRLRKAHPH